MFILSHGLTPAGGQDIIPLLPTSHFSSFPFLCFPYHSLFVALFVLLYFLCLTPIRPCRIPCISPLLIHFICVWVVIIVILFHDVCAADGGARVAVAV
jgi:hypothetical protein